MNYPYNHFGGYVGILLRKKLDQRMDGIGHMTVTNVPCYCVRVVHLSIILFCVLDQHGIARGKEEF